MYPYLLRVCVHAEEAIAAERGLVKFKLNIHCGTVPIFANTKTLEERAFELDFVKNTCAGSVRENSAHAKKFKGQEGIQLPADMTGSTQLCQCFGNLLQTSIPHPCGHCALFVLDRFYPVENSALTNR